MIRHHFGYYTEKELRLRKGNHEDIINNVEKIWKMNMTGNDIQFVSSKSVDFVEISSVTSQVPLKE